MAIEKERVDQLIKRLEEKGAKLACSRCGALKFELVGESIISIQDDPNMIVIGGLSLPVVLVACANCGNISQHALGILGMMRNPK